MKYDLFATQASMQRNYEGGEAFAMTPEMELYTAVVTSSLSATTYEGTDERVERICDLVKKVDPTFVAQLAVYARTQMNLRSIPLLLVVELARVHNGDDLVARTVDAVVRRADEIMELLACYQWRNPSHDPRKKLGHLSRQIQNGLQRAFNHFDEYQFGKYNNTSREVKLRDALFWFTLRPRTRRSSNCSTRLPATRSPRPTRGRPSYRRWDSNTSTATTPSSRPSAASGRNSSPRANWAIWR